MSTDAKINDPNSSTPTSACDKPLSQQNEKLSMKDKFKLAIRDYGSTIIFVHIGNSLILLGALYAAISSGLDLTWLIEKVGLSEKSKDMATTAGTFALAYGVNKLLAPVRFSITFACTPFIVRYLRSKGLLKPRSTK